MSLTSGLYLVAAICVWRWPLWKTLPPVGLFLLFDLSYFGANLFKIADGGWITLVVAVVITTVFTTWKKGREELKQRLLADRLPLDAFLSDIARNGLPRVRGTAVFMTLSPEGVPPTLLHHVKHNHVLHEHVMLLTIQAADVPAVADDQRVSLEDLGQGFYRLTARYGFMESPNVPQIMKLAAGCGLSVEPAKTSFYLGRETLTTAPPHDAPRKAILRSSQCGQPTVYFGILPTRCRAGRKSGLGGGCKTTAMESPLRRPRH
jgi:KUP system potassium uptake protein